MDYFTKFLIEKIFFLENTCLLYEFIDGTVFKYELGPWSIKANSKITKRHKPFINKDYFGKKPVSE